MWDFLYSMRDVDWTAFGFAVVGGLAAYFLQYLVGVGIRLAGAYVMYLKRRRLPFVACLCGHKEQLPAAMQGHILAFHPEWGMDQVKKILVRFLVAPGGRGAVVPINEGKGD